MTWILLTALLVVVLLGRRAIIAILRLVVVRVCDSVRIRWLRLLQMIGGHLYARRRMRTRRVVCLDAGMAAFCTLLGDWP